MDSNRDKKILIVGVPGAGKTTQLVRLYFRYGMDVERDTLVASLTNATLRSFITKVFGFDKGYRINKRPGTRTIYGQAFMSCLYNNDLSEDEIKMLEYKKKKEYIKSKRGLTMHKLELIENALLYSILKYKRIGLTKEGETYLEAYNISKKLAKEVLKDFKRNIFFDYLMLLERALRKNYELFKIYKIGFNESVEVYEPKYIIIDEFQDFPKIFYDELLNVNKIVFFAGDMAQQIFNFALPDPLLIYKSLDKNNIFFLRETHRFGKEITSVANTLLENMGYDYRIKTSISNSNVKLFKYNTSIFLTNLYNVYRDNNVFDIIILTRTINQLRKFAKILETHNYSYINLERYEYERLSVLLSILKSKEEVIKKILKEKGILTFLQKQEDQIISYLKKEGFTKQYIDLALKILHSNKVIYLSTIHNIKGLEFDAVFLYNQRSSLINRLMKRDIDKVIEEYRVIYTGITRPKKYLIIMNGDNPIFSSFGL